MESSVTKPFCNVTTLLRPEARISTEGRLLGWNVPPEELSHIPEHWLKYQEPPESMHYLLGTLYIFFTIMSLLGNGLVIWVFSAAKSLRTPSNMLVINLALCDFFMMCKTPVFIYNSFNRGFALGHWGCQIYGIMGAYTGIGASATNACIAYDRYNVITRPMEGKMTHGKAIMMIIFIYLYATPFVVACLTESWGRFVPGYTSDVGIYLGWNVPPHELQYIPDHWLSQHEPEAYMHYLLAFLYMIFTAMALFGNGLVIWIFICISGELQYLGWNVPPDQIQYIPEHWLTQLEPHASMHYMLGVFYTFLFFASTIGNGLVIWIFSSAKPLRTPSNLFVLNLAVFDFIMCAKAPIFIYNSFHRGFALGNTGCQIFAAIGSYSGIGAGMTNAAIGYDRYNVINKPMERTMTFTKALVMNILIWIYCTPWVVLPLTRFWDRFVPEGYLTSCTFDYLTDDFDTRLFVGTIFFFSFVCPTTMIIFYYSQIVGHVFNHEKALREQAKKMNVESLRSNVDKSKDTAEIRIAKAAITICFLFFVSWTPYGVMSLIGAFGDKSLLTPGATMIPACTCKMVACIDPFVYAISHPRYRMELQKRCPWLAINEKAPEAASSASTTSSTTQDQQTSAA